jgi:hypothetical protein
LISFKIVTLDKSPELLKTFVAPRICGHKPFKIFKIIDSDGVRHISFCVNNLAFLLNFKFHSVKKSYNDFLFEAIVSDNTDIVFHDVSRNLYYCKFAELPLLLQKFFKCLFSTSSCKDSVRYFYTWLNEKILPKFEIPVTKETDKMPINFKKTVYAPATSSELPPTNADNLRQKVIEYSIYLDTLNQLECDNDYDSDFINELRRLLIGEFDKAVRNYANSRKFI